MTSSDKRHYDDKEHIIFSGKKQKFLWTFAQDSA